MYPLSWCEAPKEVEPSIRRRSGGSMDECFSAGPRGELSCVSQRTGACAGAEDEFARILAGTKQARENYLESVPATRPPGRYRAQQSFVPCASILVRMINVAEASGHAACGGLHWPVDNRARRLLAERTRHSVASRLRRNGQIAALSVKTEGVCSTAPPSPHSLPTFPTLSRPSLGAGPRGGQERLW